MPKYTFVCDACGLSVQKYTPVLCKTIGCEMCGETVEMRRMMPSTSGPATVKELVDPYTNVHLPPDNNEILEDRRSDYFWEVMVPRLVQEYPPEHCLTEGWTYLDEKGHIQMHTKPPHKR